MPEHELTFRVRYRAADDWDPAVAGADVMAAIPTVLGDEVGNGSATLVDAETLAAPPSSEGTDRLRARLAEMALDNVHSTLDDFDVPRSCDDGTPLLLVERVAMLAGRAAPPSSSGESGSGYGQAQVAERSEGRVADRRTGEDGDGRDCGDGGADTYAGSGPGTAARDRTAASAGSAADAEVAAPPPSSDRQLERLVACFESPSALGGLEAPLNDARAHLGEDRCGACGVSKQQVLLKHDEVAELVRRAAPFVNAVAVVADDKTNALTWLADAAMFVAPPTPGEGARS